MKSLEMNIWPFSNLVAIGIETRTDIDTETKVGIEARSTFG